MRTFGDENAKSDGPNARRAADFDELAHKASNSQPHGYRQRQMYECREEFFNRVEEDVQKNGFYCSEREREMRGDAKAFDAAYQSQTDTTHFHDRNRLEQRQREPAELPETNAADNGNIRCGDSGEDVIALRSANGHIYGRIMNGRAVKEKQCAPIAPNKRLDRPIPMLPPPPSTPPPPSARSAKQVRHESLHLEHSNRGGSNGHAYDVPNGCMREMSPRDIQQRRLIRSSPLPQSHQLHQQQQQFFSHKAPLASGTHLNANRPLSHVIMNSLSSPESAYSTGYSTDGTSPGNYSLRISVDNEIGD